MTRGELDVARAMLARLASPTADETRARVRREEQARARPRVRCLGGYQHPCGCDAFTPHEEDPAGRGRDVCNACDHDRADHIEDDDELDERDERT